MTRYDDKKDHLSRGSTVPSSVSAVAGSISGLVARMCTAPLDVVKIRLQLQVTGDKYKGILGSMKTVAKEETICALWKGNVPALSLYIVYGAVQFSSYNLYNIIFTDIQDHYGFELGHASHSFVLGSLSGGTGTIVSYPFDLLRTRFVQNQKFSKFGIVVQEIIRQEGIRGFFKGLNPALVSISMYTGLVFWAYETSRKISKKIHVYPFILEPTCGFIAGSFAKGIVFPLDLVRKRLQINREKNEGFLLKGISIIKTEGIRGLYKGFFASLIKNAPTTAISIWTYQSLLRNYMRGGV